MTQNTPQITDFADVEDYYTALDAFYAAELDRQSWDDVAAGQEFDNWADSIAA
jgi:hypothetical protein